MKSRPSTIGLRTIQFHRGNPESTACNEGGDNELREDHQNQKSSKKPDDSNNFPNELLTGEGAGNCSSEDKTSVQ